MEIIDDTPGPLDALYQANAGLAARFFRAALGHVVEPVTADEIELLVTTAPKGLVHYVIQGDRICMQAVAA
jgi:hypothetical protein